MRQGLRNQLGFTSWQCLRFKVEQCGRFKVKGGGHEVYRESRRVVGSLWEAELWRSIKYDDMIGEGSILGAYARGLRGQQGNGDSTA